METQNRKLSFQRPCCNIPAVVRALKADPRTFRIPVIVLTAHASPEDVAEAAANGCLSYETKPIVLRRLLARIAEVLGSTDSVAQAEQRP
jgi:CheY-like chemotaxis protein